MTLNEANQQHADGAAFIQSKREEASKIDEAGKGEQAGDGEQAGTREETGNGEETGKNSVRRFDFAVKSVISDVSQEGGVDLTVAMTQHPMTKRQVRDVVAPHEYRAVEAALLQSVKVS